jgi:hypothetical protein
MMAGFRIVYPDETQRFGKTTKRVQKPGYLDFIRSLPCLVSGMIGVEAAHLSTANPEWGHLGRAKAAKAGDRWALPLTSKLHTEQHAGNELAFWRRHGINPYRAAVTIHGLWSDYGADAHEHVVKLIMMKPWRT